VILRLDDLVCFLYLSNDPYEQSINFYWVSVCIQGTADKLVQHLILHSSAADPTYVDDFLLTYRTFLKSSADLTSQLLTWFDDPTHTDKVNDLRIYYYFSFYRSLLFIVQFPCWFYVKSVKSFPSHKAHRAALISVSLALSQTPVYTGRPPIRG